MLEPSWVGRRVSVRRGQPHSPGGAKHQEKHHVDAVGDLLSLTATTAAVETARGIVEIDLDQVIAARIALPSTRDELALEAIAARGWQPDEVSSIGGWILRAASGFTSRANSVLPLGAPGVPLDEALTIARAWYAERGLPLQLQIPVEARRLLDAALGEQGWPFEPAVHVMARRIDTAPGLGGASVVLDAEPSDAWLAVYRGGLGATDTGRRVLTRHERVVFASITADDTVVAVGRGVVDDEWLGISAVEVAREARRTGLGRIITGALIGWGIGNGARRSYLQVSSDNEAAVAMYSALGFWTHHDYHYRRDAAR